MTLKTTTALSLACVLACSAPAFAQATASNTASPQALSDHAVSGAKANDVVAQGPGPRTGFGVSGYSKGSPWGDAGAAGPNAKPPANKPSASKPVTNKPSPNKPPVAKKPARTDAGSPGAGNAATGGVRPGGADPGTSGVNKAGGKNKPDKRSGAPKLKSGAEADVAPIVQASLNPEANAQSVAIPVSGPDADKAGAASSHSEADKSRVQTPAVPRFAIRAPLPPVRPGDLDTASGIVTAANPVAASAIADKSVATLPVAGAEAKPVAAPQQLAAAQPVETSQPEVAASAPGAGFNLFKFLSGKPQAQKAVEPEAVAEAEPRRGRNHARDASARARISPLIERHARANGIPVSLADAVIRVESRYNPAARNGPYLGLSQIHLNTARSLGYSGGAQGLLDADTNLRYGMKYLATAYRLAGGDTCRTIMKYQGGHRTERLSAHAARYCSRVRVMMVAN